MTFNTERKKKKSNKINEIKSNQNQQINVATLSPVSPAAKINQKTTNGKREMKSESEWHRGVF